MSNIKHTPDDDFEVLVADYIVDPYCRPELWISSETPILSERERFINDPRIIAAYKAAIKAALKKATE